MAKAANKGGATPKRSVAPGEAVLRLLKGERDHELLESITGGRIVRTLTEVAQFFGVQSTSVRAGWRTQGMPGRPGRFVLSEILGWKVAHDEEIAGKKSEERSRIDQFTRRTKEAEARKVELEVEKREQEMALTSGRLVDRNIVLPAFRAILAKAAEWLSTVGDEMEPEFPVDIAKEKAARINELNMRALQSAAEMAPREIAAIIGTK